MPRRRTQRIEDFSDDDAGDDTQVQPRPDDRDEDGDGDTHMEGVDTSDSSDLVKKLVRYALACEYSRTPIRRDGIKEKVLGSHGRMFKKVFANAQRQLRATFGMEMIELPARDRNLMTADQKRKAAKSQSQKEATSNAYVLVSVLPEEYRSPGILPPAKVQSADGEAAYVALYSTLIAIIQLSGGELSEPRFRRYLDRLNAGDNVPSMNPGNPHTPNEKTELVLQRMVKQGYLVKTDANKTATGGGGDADSITWHVGPRGKVEVNNEAIASIIRVIWGGSTPDLEQRLQTSLKVEERKVELPLPPVNEEEQEGGEEEQQQPGPSDRRRGRRRLPKEEAEEQD